MSLYIAAELRRRVRKHFADCCAYCRTAEWLTVVTFEIEHIVPISAGGPTEFDNLCFAYPMCNRHKADRTAGLDPTTGDLAALFHPHQDDWLEHFEWSADGDQIIPLTTTGRATVHALRMNRPQLVRTRRLWVALHQHPPSLGR